MKIFLKLIVIVVLISATLSLRCQINHPAQKKIPLIERSVFFDNPEIASGQLSPDGKYISFLKAYNGILNIWVKKFDEPFNNARRLTKLERPAPYYFWSYDGKYILYVKDKGGDENYNIYGVNPNAPAAKDSVPESRNLTPNDSVRAVIYMVSKKNPDMLMVGLNDRDARWHDLYQLEISSGKLTKLRENTNRISGWIFDWDENLRLAIRSREDGGTEFLNAASDSMKKIFECGPLEDILPLNFSKDNSRLYVKTNKGDTVNLGKLALMNPATGDMQDVERDPLNSVDLDHVMFSDSTHEMLMASYIGEKERKYFKDKNWEADYKILQTKFRGKEIDFTSMTRDERKVLVEVYSDKDARDDYFFDRNTKRVIHEYTPRPKLQQFQKYLSTVRPIKYKSSDGLEIPAYLTLPSGTASKNLPLLVIPHGGPWARDRWGFDSWAQWMANRGFAVLQSNFRGSTGYGKRFLDAGNLQWGKLMQDDITWGVKYLINKGIVDPKRVAIFGKSYGGYATLAGLAFTPDLYNCGVDYCGPSNLFTLIGTIPPYWVGFRQFFDLRVGNDSTEEDKKNLKEASPLFSASKIKAPLLILQGANDPRVTKSESEQIIVAMRNQGRNVSYIFADDEGHGFRKPINTMAAFAAVEKFLAKYCETRYQENIPDDVAKRLKQMTVNVSTVKVSPTNK